MANAYRSTEEAAIEFKEKALLRHGRLYDYSKAVYINNRSNIIIICPTHGEFTQRAAHHLAGHGCRKCSTEKASIEKSLTTEEYLKRCQSVPEIGNYDLSQVVYKNSTTKIKVICKEHGEFNVLPDSLLKGHKCRKCIKYHEFNKFSRTGFDSFCKAMKRIPTFYLVELSSDDERFLKIGITSQTTKRRFQVAGKALSNLYQLKILKEITTDPITVFNLEKILIKKYSPHKYTPKFEFSGMHECICIDQLNNLINEL